MRSAATVLFVLSAVLGCAGPDAATSQGPEAEDGLQIPVLRGPTGGANLLNDHPVGTCFRQAHVLLIKPDPVALDDAIDAADGAVGWIVVPIGGARVPSTARYFHGSLEAAVTAFGATKLAIGVRGDRWIRLADGTDQQILDLETPKGRIVWQTGGTVRVVPCPPDS